MKILFLTRRAYPDIGGVETHIQKITEELGKKGHNVKIISERDLKIGGDDWFKKFRIWGKMFAFAPKIFSSDVIHCHDVLFWYLPFRFLFPWKKVFVTFHGYETKFPPRFGAIIMRRLSNFLANGSINVGDYIEKWYGTKADYVTYGGVGKVKIQNSKIKSTDKKFKILFFGRLDSDNSVDIYLNTLKLLKEKKIKFEFIAIGDGNRRKQTEKFGKVFGFVEDASKNIAEANIILASSYLSVLEALVAKRPVFAAYSNDLKRDYLEMSPFSKFITISSDPHELASQILSSNSKKINSGYEWASKQTWEKVTDIYLKLWKK